MANRTIAVTGAFGALGAAVARAAGGRGWRVALLGRAPSAPAGLVDSCGPGAFALGNVDLSDTANSESAVKEVAARLGGLEALINVAGGFAAQNIADGDPALWDRMFDGNLKTALNASHAAVPFLTQSAAGRIVNIGAFAALNPAGAGMGPYTASKAAVHKLTESLAAELKGKVTVNAVLPTTLDTPANRSGLPKADFASWVTLEEAANLILFLASPEAGGVTGALIPLKGRV